MERWRKVLYFIVSIKIWTNTILTRYIYYQLCSSHAQNIQHYFYRALSISSLTLAPFCQTFTWADHPPLGCCLATCPESGAISVSVSRPFGAVRTRDNWYEIQIILPTTECNRLYCQYNERSWWAGECCRAGAHEHPWMHTCSRLAPMTLRCASRCITMHLSAGCQFLIGSDSFWDRVSARLKRYHGFVIIRLFSRSGEAAIKLLMGSLAIQQDQIVENKLGRRRKPVSLDSHVRPIRGQYAGHVITLDQSVSLVSHVRPGGPEPSQRWRAGAELLPNSTNTIHQYNTIKRWQNYEWGGLILF